MLQRSSARMRRGSSRVMHRMGSYFGVENTEGSSLDLWKEKLERAAKVELFILFLTDC